MLRQARVGRWRAGGTAGAGEVRATVLGAAGAAAYMHQGSRGRCGRSMSGGGEHKGRARVESVVGAVVGAAVGAAAGARHVVETVVAVRTN